MCPSMALETGQPAPTGDQHSGVTRMHPVGDAYIAWRLFKEVLHRTTGLPRDASLLATLFTVGVLANAFRRLASPVLRVFRPKRPSLADALIAGAVLREVPGSIAGERARGTPFAGAMILFGLAAGGRRPEVVKPAFRGLRSLAAFARRYGV